jgi:CRISPR system Cascade subunit CasB
MSKADDIGNIVSKKVGWLSLSGAKQRAALAKLRRGIGREPGDTPEIWDIILAELPESLTGWDGTTTRAEYAIHTSLTLFALHQQGKGEPVSYPGISFGTAIRRLVSPDKGNEQAVKRRFDATVTARDFIEFAQHARGLVQLMKANDVLLDYSRFAKDLYWFQDTEQKTKVMLRWGQDFWAPVKSEQDEQDNQEETE